MTTGKKGVKPSLQPSKAGIRSAVSVGREKVGFIFECGPGGPDYVVASHFLGRLNPKIEMVPRFSNNAEQLLTECGEVAAGLLCECARVVIMWDLEPTWEKSKKACRREDKEKALKSLAGARVDQRKVLLLCVEKELECWLMVDERAVGAVLARYKSKDRIGDIPEFKKPDTEIKKPKTELISLFQKELRGQKYVDRTHALLLARAVPNWSRLKRSPSFCRFASKAALVNLALM